MAICLVRFFCSNQEARHVTPSSKITPPPSANGLRHGINALLAKYVADRDGLLTYFDNLAPDTFICVTPLSAFAQRAGRPAMRFGRIALPVPNAASCDIR